MLLLSIMFKMSVELCVYIHDHHVTIKMPVNALWLIILVKGESYHVYFQIDIIAV